MAMWDVSAQVAEGTAPLKAVMQREESNVSSWVPSVYCFPLVEFRYVGSQLFHISVSSGSLKATEGDVSPTVAG